MTVSEFLANDINQMALGLGALLFSTHCLLNYISSSRW
jgi:hypothetical protein